MVVEYMNEWPLVFSDYFILHQTLLKQDDTQARSDYGLCITKDVKTNSYKEKVESIICVSLCAACCILLEKGCHTGKVRTEQRMS